jgi:hypothetical protein
MDVLANSGQQPAAIIKVGVEIFSPLGIELKPQFRVTIAKSNLILEAVAANGTGLTIQPFWRL